MNRSQLFAKVLLVIVIVCAACSSTAVSQSPLPAKVLADIVVSRQAARNYVNAVKSYWDPSTQEYQTAKTRYDAAKAKYDGWIAAVKLAIVSSSVNSLSTDAQYRTLSSEADTAVKRFSDFVDSLPRDVPGKGIWGKVSLTKNGVAVAAAAQNPPSAKKGKGPRRPMRKKETASEKTQRLQTIATYFQAQAEWEEWDKIQP